MMKVHKQKQNPPYSTPQWSTLKQLEVVFFFKMYRKISNISCTKFQNLFDFRFILQFSLPNPLKPGVVKLTMKM